MIKSAPWVARKTDFFYENSKNSVQFDAYNAFQTNTERDMEETKHTQE
jgi:hypothetical protein